MTYKHDLLDLYDTACRVSRIANATRQPTAEALAEIVAEIRCLIDHDCTRAEHEMAKATKAWADAARQMGGCY